MQTLYILKKFHELVFGIFLGQLWAKKDQKTPNSGFGGNGGGRDPLKLIQKNVWHYFHKIYHFQSILVPSLSKSDKK